MIFCGLGGATIAGLIIDYTKRFKEITVITFALAILCLIWFTEVVRWAFMLLEIECRDFSVAPVDIKGSLFWQLHLVRTYLANILTRCSTPPLPRGVKTYIGKISSN